MANAFFSRPEIKDQLWQAQSRLEILNQDSSDEKQRLLIRTLQIIHGNTQVFDESCQINIEWIGEQIASALIRVASRDATREEIDDLYGSLYRCIVEFDLSRKDDLSMDLRKFRSLITEHPSFFTKQALEDVEFARQEMPLAMTKRLLANSVIRGLGNVDKIAEDIDLKIKGWDEKIASRQDAASKLEQSLKGYETGFNFVGLAQGFEDLLKKKTEELSSTKVWLALFGLAALLPLTIELLLLYFNQDRLDEVKWFFIVSSIPAISLTLLLIYFFRISLRNAESARAQVLQIELRRTLCRFIQSYSDYSGPLKKENPDALSKFENIVFSGIVSMDEKLPSTFDGVEQIAGLVKAIRGGSLT